MTLTIKRGHEFWEVSSGVRNPIDNKPMFTTGCGNTVPEALGHFLMKNKQLLGARIEYSKDEYTTMYRSMALTPEI
jgi:hypothetical protein